MPKTSRPSLRFYPAKLLLFGEHIIHRGAKGLAVPVERFGGSFNFIREEWNETAVASNRSLQVLAEYIIYHETLSKLYDTNRLLSDLEHGLYFNSDIPQGYGLGSSGAIVAAVCENYRLTAIKSDNTDCIKDELALLESCFHGRSSGLDPLVCFLRKAVLVEKGLVSKLFDMPKPEKPGYHIFIIDSGKPRKTDYWVKLFMQKCKDPKFELIVSESLIKANDLCIQSMLVPGYRSFWRSLKIISQVQFDHLPEFIPEALRSTWRKGLEGNDYHLKLCGAGGGGFLLGFCRADYNINMHLAEFPLTTLGNF